MGILEQIQKGDGRQKRAWAHVLYSQLKDTLLDPSILDQMPLGYFLATKEAIRVLDSVQGFHPHVEKLREARQRVIGDVNLVEAEVSKDFGDGRYELKFSKDWDYSTSDWIDNGTLTVGERVFAFCGVVGAYNTGLMGMQTLAVITPQDLELDRRTKRLYDQFKIVPFTDELL